VRLGVFRDYGARNSAPVFDAFCRGAEVIGWQCVNNDLTADCAVIWSMLWRGRMRGNQEVWQRYRDTGRPVVVLEVGMLRRGHTWRMGLGRADGTVGWCPPVDDQRSMKLGITPAPWRSRGHHILIAVQRPDSQQWLIMPDINTWLNQTIDHVRRVSNRPIRVRSHPRYPVAAPAGVEVSRPRAVPGTYDGFDFDRDLQGAWAVINANSGPGPQAVIQGVPAFVHPSSLAAPVANLTLDDIEHPRMPDRRQWLTEICHTEWTLEEFQSGWPQKLLLASD
jgi:hypothetical protein